MNLNNTLAALPLAFRKLDPRQMIHSPVMFTVLIGSIVCTAVSIQQLAIGSDSAVFSLIVTVWLWLTVLFGNLSEAIAEGRGKAQADSLRAARTSVMARRRTRALVPAGASGAGRRTATDMKRSWCPAPTSRWVTLSSVKRGT